MKNTMMRVFSLLLVLLCVQATFAYSSNDRKSVENCQSCEKTYILPCQLKMTTESIFVNFDDEWYETKAIFSDSHGIYIQHPSLGKRWGNDPPNGCRDGYVPCRNCDKCVDERFNYCPHCEKPV